MFYPSYDDYMRDIFYYNGLAGNNTGYQVNPMVTRGMTGGGYMNNAMNYNPMMPMNNSNINNLYPSIYRIVYPVVQKVISGSNFQIINEEAISNATNTIYDIVEGDLNSAQTSTQSYNPNSNSNQNSNMNSNNSNMSNQNMQSSSNNNMQNQTNRNQNNSNLLLKDLIRILVIRELLSRNNVRRFPFNNQPYYMNNQFMPSYVF